MSNKFLQWINSTMFLRLNFNISGILYANSKSSEPQVEKSTIPIKIHLITSIIKELRTSRVYFEKTDEWNWIGHDKMKDKYGYD